MQKFIRLVQEMRNAQKAFFKDRKRSDLETAKKLERKVDQWLEDNTEQKALMQAMTLFPNDKGA